MSVRLLRIIKAQVRELRLGAVMFGLTDDVEIIRLLIAAVEIRRGAWKS